MAFIKEARGKPPPKPGFKGIGAIKLSPSFGTATRTILARKPAPKPKPVPKPAPKPRQGTFAFPTPTQMRNPVFRAHQANAQRQYRINLARSLKGPSPFVPSIVRQEFGGIIRDPGVTPRVYERPSPRIPSAIATGVSVARTAPKHSVIENLKDPLGQDPNYGIHQVTNFLGTQRALAQQRDAATTQATGKPSFKHVKAFDNSIRHDPYVSRLASDKQKGFQNVASLSAAGIPIGGKAADDYIRTTGEIVRQGFTAPGTVPGLVLDSSESEAILQLKAQVKALGYTQAQINKMNFGQLAAAAQAKSQYHSLYSGPGGRLFGTLLREGPKELGQMVLGIPMAGLTALASVKRDIRTGQLYNPWTSLKDTGRFLADVPGAVYYGHDIRAPKLLGPATTAYAQQNITGTTELARGLHEHPYYTLTHNPVSVGLAVTGGGRLLGNIGRLPRFAAGQRRVAVHEGRNVVPMGKAVMVETPVPDLPHMVTRPGDPIPAPPLYTAPRTLEAHFGQRVGEPGVAGPLHYEAGPATAQGRYLPPAADHTPAEANTSRVAHDDMHNLHDATVNEQGQRLLSNPARRQEELDALKLERDHHQAEAARLREEKKGINPEHIEQVIKKVHEDIGAVQERLAKKPKSKALQRKLDDLMSTLQDQQELRTQAIAQRKEHNISLKTHNDWVHYLDHYISLAHIHYGIPHPEAALRLRQINARLEKGVRKGTTVSDIEALHRERESLLSQQHDTTLDTFKKGSIPTEDWFDSDHPLSPAAHATDAFEHLWKDSVPGDHHFNSKQAAQDMHDILDATDHVLHGGEEPLPDHIQTQVDAAVRDAQELFGEHINTLDTQLHPEMAARVQEYMRRVRDRVLADHKDDYNRERHRDPAQQAIDEYEWQKRYEEEQQKQAAQDAGSREQFAADKEFANSHGYDDALRHKMEEPEVYLEAGKLDSLHTGLKDIDENMRLLREELKKETRPSLAREQIEWHMEQLKAGRKRINDAIAQHGDIPAVPEQPAHAWPHPTEYDLADVMAHPYRYRDAGRIQHLHDALLQIDRDLQGLRRTYGDPRLSLEQRNAIESRISTMNEARKRIVQTIANTPETGIQRPRFLRHREALARREEPATPPAEGAPYQMPPVAREVGPVPEPQLPVPYVGGLAREGEAAQFTEPGLAPSAYRGFGSDRTGQPQIGAPSSSLATRKTYMSKALQDIDQKLIVHRGRYADNLLDRMFQIVDDKILAADPEKPRIGGKITERAIKNRQQRFLSGRYETKQAHARRVFYMKREELAPLAELATKLSSTEMVAAVQAHLQGVTPREMLRAYKNLVEFSNAALKKAAFPEELRRILKHERTPTPESLDAMEAFLKGKPEWEPHLQWLRRYRKYVENENYIDDHLFGDIIWSSWKGNKDLENQVKLWQKVVDKEGDRISKPMQAFMTEARKQSGRIDNLLEENGILTRSIMDNRKYQRQNLISSILGEEFHPRTHAIYVPDRATTTRFGDYLFRRSLKYDPESVFGGRLQKHRGKLLTEGRINPSFGTFYTGLTSAVSKLDAIKLQKETLDQFGLKVDPAQEAYDGRKFVLYDASKGTPIKQEQMRQIMEALHQDVGIENQLESFMHQRVSAEQDLRWMNKDVMGRTGLTHAQKRAAENGDLYLIPRPVYERMTAPKRSTAAQTVIGRNLQIMTRGFRRVALGWRPAYLIVNSVESAFRTGYFGGLVTPAPYVRALRMSREERRKLVPQELERMTYAGNTLTRLHSGGTQWDWVNDLKGWGHDAVVGASRVPYFGPPVELARAGMRAVGKYPDFILSNTARAENYLREAMIIHKLLKEGRRQKYSGFDPRRYLKGMDEDMRVLTEKIANGEDITKGDAMDRVVGDTIRVLGDFSKAENKFAQTLFPFYRWIAFITKFTLWEAPTHYPGRTLLLGALGKQSFANLQAMGMMGANVAGAIPLSGQATDEYNKQWDQQDKVVQVLYTQAWNGMSTVAQLIGLDPATGEISPRQGFAHNVNPFIQAAFAGFTLTDPGSGRALTGSKLPLNKEFWPKVATQVFVSQFLKAFWPLVIGYDYSTQADNSIPLIHEVLKRQGAMAQPQTTSEEQITAILTGLRRRKFDLTKLQMKNMSDALKAYGDVRKSLGNDDPNNTNDTPAQTKWDDDVANSVENQLRYLSAWVAKYGDKSIRPDWQPVIDEARISSMPANTPAEIAARDKARGYTDAEVAALP